MPGLAAKADARGAEVQVLGEVLALERRREQAHHVHGGGAAPRGERLAFVLFIDWKMAGELADHMPQMVNLLLARDVAVGAARVLDVLLARHDLPERLGLVAGGL